MSSLRGEAKYEACVALAREYGVLTPEDPFATWRGCEGGPAVVCPVFTLYDYSFAPDDVPRGGEVAWAAERDLQATDEFLLHPDPHPSRPAWCAALVARFEARLAEAAASIAAAKAVAVAEAEAESEAGREDGGGEKKKKKTEEVPKLIIANHWPLLEGLVYLPAIPRFRIWCGTRRTADWPDRFGAAVVVSGHLHIRRTDWIRGGGAGAVRFEECSLGYPRQWQRARDVGRDINAFLREILPGPPPPPPEELGEDGAVTKWLLNGTP